MLNRDYLTDFNLRKYLSSCLRRLKLGNDSVNAVISTYADLVFPVCVGFQEEARRKVQLGRGGVAGSGPRGSGPDSMNLRRSLSVDHIDRFQFVEDGSIII